MARLITLCLLSLAVAGSQPLSAKDYILKLELSAEVESKVGNEESSKKSEVRTIEILLAPERRFQGKATWEKELPSASAKESLSVKGTWAELKDGTLEIRIDCLHSLNVTPHGQPGGDASQPKFEDSKLSASTFLTVIPGKTISFAESIAKRIEPSETHSGIRKTNESRLFRLTVIADEGALSPTQ